MNTAVLLDRWATLSADLAPLTAPVRTEHDCEEIEALLDAVSDRMETPEDPRYIGLFRYLATNLKAWEDQHVTIPDATPHEMLSFYMEQRELTLGDLSRGTQIDKGNLSKMVRGERELSLDNIRTLSAFFQVSPAVFV